MLLHLAQRSTLLASLTLFSVFSFLASPSYAQSKRWSLGDVEVEPPSNTTEEKEVKFSNAEVKKFEQSFLIAMNETVHALEVKQSNNKTKTDSDKHDITYAFNLHSNNMHRHMRLFCDTFDTKPIAEEIKKLRDLCEPKQAGAPIPDNCLVLREHQEKKSNGTSSKGMDTISTPDAAKQTTKYKVDEVGLFFAKHELLEQACKLIYNALNGTLEKEVFRVGANGTRIAPPSHGYAVKELPSRWFAAVMVLFAGVLFL
ncbi:hypothetical protein BJ508DRAFT_341007 [Ascobolus immersus RN42]|uniref:Uncharacterized protein n=1 Tax=Ascobolus immersus RN42 TaxID=1160509 RepID=A0A3N4IED3_ASCIM|nr:hypothetical protein BJ508DRAFT_341007 [Ascobolus immersus RN42]